MLSLLTFTVTNSLLRFCYTQKGDRSDSKKEKEESVQNPSQPHPQPLSEWRGEWRVPLTTEQITHPPAHSWTCQLTPTTHLLVNSWTCQLVDLSTCTLINLHTNLYKKEVKFGCLFFLLYLCTRKTADMAQLVEQRIRNA